MIQEIYKKEAIKQMRAKFNLKNDLAAPKITKVVINVGFNPNTKDEKAREEITRDIALIAGQKPSYRQAKKSVSSFKTRQGMVVGLAVTLRKRKMYDFLDRLVGIALPRTRDFRGLAESNIDKMGNLNIGVKEHIIFPEISAEKAKEIFGLEIAITTNAKDREKGKELFRLLGFPIKGLMNR